MGPMISSSDNERLKLVRKLHDRFIERGVELKASASPEEFAGYLKNEFDKKAKLAKEANIRID